MQNANQGGEISIIFTVLVAPYGFKQQLFLWDSTHQIGHTFENIRSKKAKGNECH